MTSLINMSEEQHAQQLKRRHRRGTTYENIYRLSLLVAIVALVTLLIQISNNAFGPVLTVPLVEPSELADEPLADLTEEELSSILVGEMGGQFLNLFRDRYGRLTGTDFLGVPLSESLNNNVTLPDGIDADEVTYRDLSSDQLAAIVTANESQQAILNFVESQVIGEDIILEWSWLTWLFNRGRVYEESAIELASDIGRDGLREAGDEITVESLGGSDSLVTALGEEEAQRVAEDFVAIQSVLLETDWNMQSRRVRVSNELSEQSPTQTSEEVTEAIAADLQPELEAAFNDAGIPEEKSTRIAEIFSVQIAEESGIEELGSLNRIETLSILMLAPMEQVLRAGDYPLGEVEFRSWITPYFLTQPGSNSVPELVSLRTAILGSIWVMIITMVTSFPLGVGAAIYLEEYASDNWLNNIIETNIRNLAGVPSIIYGLLGLAVFVRALAIFTSGAFADPSADQATLSGRTVMSAGLTLSLLILPVIIINSQEAIRAVPSTIREASYGLGATKWQTIWRQILPAAVPGILTGTILAFSRAVGETAPLIVVGASTAIASDPTLFSSFTVIPIQIFNWTGESRSEYAHLAAAAIIVLLFLLIVLNATAITLRNRYSQS